MEKLANSENLTKEQQKELFVATLVHDLKNPLNAQIITLEQFYKEKFGKINQLQKEIINDIVKSSKYMRDMISSLLQVYKFDNGVVKLDKTDVDLDNLIKFCINDIKPLAEENRIFIDYINISKASNLYCDENYIRRLMNNLLNNLVKYSYKDSKALILLQDDNSTIVIRLKSKGLPIPDDLKLHIFDKYNSGNYKKSGVGLGLYFCKKVVEAHNGIITLNTNNSDIEFCVRIPKIQKENNILIFN